jgi:D-alanyl-D-alanine dipeptidase
LPRVRGSAGNTPVLHRSWRPLSVGVAAIMLLMTPAQASADVPPVSPQAQAAGLVDVRTVIPDALIDLRYATVNNFVGVALYPADARCLVHESLAEGLAKAADVLRRSGERLVFWDCYRPHDVQVRMFDAVPNPNWVARPTEFARSHESGRSVDVTLAVAHYGWRVDMGTDFDDFTPRSMAYATEGVTAEQQANRARLRNAMTAGGLTVYSGEWWHFDGPGADQPRPILDVPVN